MFEIDGGVKVDNIVEIVKVGVDIFVVGLVVFGKLDVDGGYCGIVGVLC